MFIFRDSHALKINKSINRSVIHKPVNEAIALDMNVNITYSYHGNAKNKCKTIFSNIMQILLIKA